MNNPLDREKQRFRKLENNYLQKKLKKQDSRLNQLLEKKVPEKLQKTLDQAFAKAFLLVFEKGTGIIEKTYNKTKLMQDYEINDYAIKVRQNRRSLSVFHKRARGTGAVNLVASGVTGMGLGILGIGIPDIAVFTGLMLKGIYEIALNYGYSYEEEEEKKFILCIIQGALSSGKEFSETDTRLNWYIDNGTFLEDKGIQDFIENTAGCLSKELLYMKFLQGIPIVGIVGGAYDAVYMKEIMEYTRLKYQRRFLFDKTK